MALSINNNPASLAVTSSHADAVQSKIISTTEALKGLAADLEQLVAALQAEMANEPKPPQMPPAPGPKASKEEVAAYQATCKQLTDDFNAQMEAWKGRVNDLRGKIEKKSDEIEKKGEELQKLSTQDMPEAQRKDADEAAKAADDAKKAAEAQLQAMSQAEKQDKTEEKTEDRRDTQPKDALKQFTKPLVCVPGSGLPNDPRI